MTDGAKRGLVDRMVGAAFLNIDTYEEVEADTSATGQAAAVVAIVAVAEALGRWALGPVGMLAGVAGALVRWLVFAGVTYVIGDKLLGGTATWGELLRTLGFAQAPGVLMVAMAIPLLGWPVALAGALWILVTGIVAIRQAPDFSTGKAILTAVLGLIPYAILMAMFRPGA